MKTLLTLFSKERSELETEINKATSPEQVVKLVQNRLDGLERSYIGELSVAQVRLASFFLETLRHSISTLTAANETRISEPEPQQITNQTTRFPPQPLNVARAEKVKKMKMLLPYHRLPTTYHL
jgi:hypothetical protein